MQSLPLPPSSFSNNASSTRSSEHDDKYDRQLRLWGADGQRKLMQSRILLLYASPSGSETLKNLVLPGVGEVCIIDNNLVSSSDCNNNFFVSPNDIGQPRAKVVLDYLLEMNPDVKGSYVHTENITPLEYLKKDRIFLQSFSIVIGADLCEMEMVELNKLGKSSTMVAENTSKMDTTDTLPMVFVLFLLHLL